MIAKALKLKNFWSHKNTEITFDKDFYVILGRILGESKSNGSGKSSIPRSICFALYGDASDEINNNEAIYNDEDKMSVEFTFELNNNAYVITRKLKRGGSPKITISINGGEHVKYKLKEGQEFINKLLGADFNIFKNTSYFKQGDLDSFSKLTPAQAKEVVIKLLQLDSYNVYEEKAKDKVNEVKVGIADIETKLGKLDVLILSEERKSNSRRFTDADKVRVESLIADLKSKQIVVKQAFDKRNDEILKITKVIGEQKAEISNVRVTISQVNKRRDKLTGLGKVCPTCESSLNENDISKIVNLVDKELTSMGESIIPLNKNLSKLESQEQEARNIPLDTRDYYSEISTASVELGEISLELQQAQQDANKIQKYKDNLTKGQSILKEKNELLARYEELKVAFGKKGIQAYIVENVIPEIQTTTNDILESLDTDIRVIINSQKELKKGGKSETLDISVLTPFGERPYTNYSGGEKTLIDFALRIALSIILTRRSECKIQTLILDEVFSELDSANKQIISKALRVIANKFNFKKILIISHAEELQDSFDDVIRVVFNGKESKIE